MSARTSVLNRDRADGWISGGATAELRERASTAHQDIVVPEGASRLDLVMTWDEPPTDTIGSAVLNDLDLWLDRDGDCGAEACGEYGSASRVDNVEWIILRNPPPGVYRAKVVAHRVYTCTAPRGAGVDGDTGRIHPESQDRLPTRMILDRGPGKRADPDLDRGRVRGCRDAAAHRLPRRRRLFRLQRSPDPHHGCVPRGWSDGGFVG